MEYVLIWCSALGIFALHGPGGSSKTFSRDELCAKFDGDAILMQWMEFAEKNADVRCEYDFLPK